MNKILLAVALMSISALASAQETIVHADGSRETRTPRTENVCTAEQRLTYGAVGALVGGAVGALGSKASNSPNQGWWTAGGVVVGGLTGYTAQKLQDCDKLVGYNVVRTSKAGVTTTTFEAVK